MNAPAPTLKHRKLIFLLGIFISMLFVHGLKVHVHTYTHDAATLGHTHYTMAHSVFDFSHQPHADEVAQLDSSHAGFVGKISTVPMLAVLLVCLLLIPRSNRCSHLSRNVLRQTPSTQFDGQLRPPLRAPPQ